MKQLNKRLAALEGVLQSREQNTEKAVVKYLLAVQNGADRMELDKRYDKAVATGSSLPLLHNY